MACLGCMHGHSFVLICSDTLRIDCFKILLLLACCVLSWPFWGIVAFEPLLVLNSFVDISGAGADNDNL